MSAACRSLLTVIADALALPPPANERDEVAFLRLSRERARLVVWACRAAQDDEEGLQTAVVRLREQVAESPDCGYIHHPMRCQD
jgi:hypothetical protein